MSVDESLPQVLCSSRFIKLFRLTKEYAETKAELEAKMSKLIEENTRKAKAAADDAQ